MAAVFVKRKRSTKDQKQIRNTERGTFATLMASVSSIRLSKLSFPGTALIVSHRKCVAMMASTEHSTSSPVVGAHPACA